MTAPPDHSIKAGWFQGKVFDWLAILPVVLFALYWRLRTLDEMSLWCDEIGQVIQYYSDSIREVMYKAVSVQGQQPLDYWIGYFVVKISQSDFAVRLPATVFGTLLIPCTFFLARKMVSRSTAFLVAVGITCAPYSIHYSQEARPYTIFWFSLVLSMLLLSRAWEHNRWWDWVLFWPVLFFCQMSRTLAPLMITTGIGIWALASMYGEFRKNRASFFRSLFQHRATRLSMCLVTVWIPFFYIFSFILHKMNKIKYLSDDAAEVFDWQNNLATLTRTGESLVQITMPLGLILLPLGAVGMILYLRRCKESDPTPHRVIFVPVLIGFVIHVLVYVFMVSRFVPKYVYWAYLLPFIYLGAGYALQCVVSWWRAKRYAGTPLTFMWVLALLVLAMQLGVDHKAAILHKPDWRAALRTISAHDIQPERDVVFCGHPSCEYGRGMRFWVSPHYWPTDEHMVHLLRDKHLLYNDGQPILNKHDCRVALLARCGPDINIPALSPRMSAESRSAFEFYGFHQFFVLISRQRYETAEASLEDLERALLEMLGKDNPLVLDVNIAQVWSLAKDGKYKQARELYTMVRSLVPSFELNWFDDRQEELVAYLQNNDAKQTRLISSPHQ